MSSRLPAEAGARDAAAAERQAPSPRRGPPHTLPPHVVHALQTGTKIDAIRLLRRHAGIDLKAAKAAVDAYQQHRRLSPGEVPRQSALWAWSAAALIAIAAWVAHRVGV